MKDYKYCAIAIGDKVIRFLTPIMCECVRKASGK
jgi:hypothetical protein